MDHIPAAFHGITGIGQPLEYYPLRRKGLVRWGGLLLGLGLFSAGVLILAYTLDEAYLRYYLHGPAALTRQLMFPGVLAGLLCVCAIYLWGKTARAWKRAAVRYEHGFAYQGMRGVEAFHWNGIASTQAILYRGLFSVSHRYAITGMNGKQIILDDSIAQVTDLARAIRENTAPAILSRASQAFEAGQTVDFGTLRIAREKGLTLRRNTHAWSSVKEILVKRGQVRVSIQKDGKHPRTYQLPVAQLKNLEVLLAVVGQIGIPIQVQ